MAVDYRIQNVERDAAAIAGEPDGLADEGQVFVRERQPAFQQASCNTRSLARNSIDPRHKRFGRKLRAASQTRKHGL